MKNGMLPKDVLYNGGNGNYFSLSNSTDLVPFKHYIVEQATEVNGQLKYRLYGLSGYYNASWFDDVKKQVLVYTDQIPIAKKRLECVISDSEEIVVTSVVQYVEPITSILYKVTTRSKSLYLVVVL